MSKLGEKWKASRARDVEISAAREEVIQAAKDARARNLHVTLPDFLLDALARLDALEGEK